MKPLILTVTERCAGLTGRDSVRRFEISLDEHVDEPQIRRLLDPVVARDRSVTISVGHVANANRVELELKIEASP